MSAQASNSLKRLRAGAPLSDAPRRSVLRLTASTGAPRGVNLALEWAAGVAAVDPAPHAFHRPLRFLELGPEQPKPAAKRLFGERRPACSAARQGIGRV